MVDNVSPLPDMKERKRNVERAQKESLDRRQLEARELRNKLYGSRERLNEEIRRAFARNNGKMAERVASELGVDPLQITKRAIAKIYRVELDAMSFADAVSSNQQAALSLWKKRKRYVRFDGEEAAKEVGAVQRHFVDIAESIASINSQDIPDELKMMRAIFNLVEGTKFDRQYIPADLVKLDEREEYATRLNDLLQKILSSNDIDLARYFKNLAKFPMCVVESDANGKWLKLGKLGAETYLYGPSESDTSISAAAEDGEWSSSETQIFLPQVHIGSLCVPHVVEFAVPVLVSEEAGKAEFERVLVERYGKEIRREFSFSPNRSPKKINWRKLKDKYDELGRDLTNWINAERPAAQNPVVWSRYEVVLSVAPERSTGQIRLFVGYHCHTDAPEWDVVVHIGKTLADDVRGIWAEFWNEKIPFAMGWLFPVRIPVSNVVQFIFPGTVLGSWQTEDEAFFKILRANGSAGLRIAVRNAHTLERAQLTNEPLLAGNELHFFRDWLFRPAIVDAPGNYVPVPEQSVAAVILRNLLFAEPDKRIDTLLIEDAKYKSKLVDAALEEAMATYREAVAQFIRSNSSDVQGQ